MTGTDTSRMCKFVGDKLSGEDRVFLGHLIRGHLQVILFHAEDGDLDAVRLEMDAANVSLRRMGL